MSGDDITNAELARRLDAFRRDVHDDLSDISRRMDAYVLREVYQAERLADQTRIGVLERRVDQGDEQRRAQSRWLISAVIIPTVALVATVVLNLMGPT
ncbi:hypothetical protein [Micromonospora sp. NPDC048839]|uniref:hypothetical protein n=1 Tax=Micromonospora sp. NPDC048839 TaxID=3155641 RepID=UPI0034020641